MHTLWKIIKTIFKIIIWAILLIALLAVILYFCAGKLVQHIAPDFISKVTQTETGLGDVDISLFSGKLAINDLTIGNPAGFKDKNAFQLGKLAVKFDPKSLLTNKVVINNVDISGVNVSTELNAAGKTNVTELLNNINKFVGTKEPAPQKAKTNAQPTPTTTEKTESKSVVIRDLAITDSAVRAGIAGQMQDIPLPEIRQQNIGEQKPMTPAEVVMTVLNTLNAESTKAVIKATKESLERNVQAGKDTVKTVKDTFKDLF